MMNQVQYTQFGKYLLLDRIAVGGMAEVYRAKFFGAERFEKILAIKKLLPNIAEDEEFVEMFINEAKLASQLTHSNICQIYDLGKIEGNLFIAMEYVWGKDLLQIINHFRRRKEFMPPPMASYIVTRICEGIDYAYHKRGAQGMPLKIIHRDVSPQNILISYDGEVKIIDFGIAKATLHHSETQAGLLKGKFSYMSPEQVQGFPIDHRSDIFAIGTVLFEMLTSMSLFRGENDFITLERVRKAEVPKPTEVNSKTPKSLEKILLKALALDPKDRWQRAADFQDALQRFLITTPPIYTAKRLSDWMRVTFGMDIENDKSRMEEYAKLGPEALRRSMPPSQPPKALSDKRGSPVPPKRTLLGFGPPPLPADKQPAAGQVDQPIMVPRSSSENIPIPPMASERRPPPVPVPGKPHPPKRPPAPPPGAPPVSVSKPPPPPQSASAPLGQSMPPMPAVVPANSPFGVSPPGMQPVGAAPFQPSPMQSAGNVAGFQDPSIMEVTPRIETIPGGGASSTPAPMPPENPDEKKKIVAIPKHDGRGMTTTTLKTDGGVEFEEDEEPTRALDEDAAQLIDDAMRIDTSGLKDTGEPVFSDSPLKKKGAATGQSQPVQEQVQAAQGQVKAAQGQATPPGAVPYPAPPPEMMGAFPHGTVAIGPDGQPLFIPFIPQKQGALSAAMKWVLVMAITMILMVIGGVVVYILVTQTKGRVGAGKEPAELEMDENQGAVMLRVFPSTANVKVNGKEVPREKLAEPIIVPAKVPFEVEVWQDGYRKEKFPLLVPSKSTITKEVALQELQGRVIVNSVPDKAEVYVGGQLKGETPVTIDEFPINERVTITVKKRDFVLWSEVVELNEEKTERTLVAILQKAGKKGKEIIPIVASKEGSGKPAKEGSEEPAKGKIKKETGSSKKKGKETSTTPTTTGGGKGEGFFIALTKPWAKVLINGKDTGRKTPIVPTNPIKLAPGSYKVTFVLPTGESYNFNIKIKTGEQTKLIKNFEQ